MGSFLVGERRLIPIIKNTIPESSLSKKSGIRLAIEPPANAPRSVASIRAIDEPINTANGLFVVLLKVIVVNCVLSPISARNIVKNVVIRRVSSINQFNFYFCIKSIKPCETKYSPKLNIIIPETTVKLCLGKLFAIHCPIRTPSRLVEIRARAAPIKIINGLPD